MRGVVYAKLEKYTDAISDFIKAVEIDPKYHRRLLQSRQLRIAQLEQYDLAIKYFSKTHRNRSEICHGI